MAKETLDLYFAMQNLNRATIKYAAGMIKVGMNLPDIKALCENYLLENGADSFWYWDVGAFVFSGNETVVSVSGKDYNVTDRTIQENDIITIDLSPQRNNIWGDYVRTLVFENGVLCDETDRIKKDDWRRGLQMEKYLHKTLIDIATPGKSTLGKALAQKLHFYFIDNEDLYFPKTNPTYIYAAPRTREEVERLL